MLCGLTVSVTIASNYDRFKNRLDCKGVGALIGMFSFGASRIQGATAAAVPSTPGGFTFGQPPVTPSTPGASSNSFGGGAFGLTPAAQPATTQAVPTQAVVQASAPVSSFSAHPFQYIQQCYDPSSLNYRFRTYFYNQVEGGIARYPQTKPPVINDRLWTQIQNDNPDPNEMIPVMAAGFEDLRARAGWQDEQMGAQTGKVRELEERLGALLKRADLETTSQLQQIQKQQLKLVQRVISVLENG